jgi:membrane protein implicated in regulation of membrane protease activity
VFHINVDLGNLVFALALIVGFVLLLITVVLDDVVGGVMDGLHVGVDIGGVSLAPIALGFVAMFGIGGLFGTTVLDLRSGPASLVGVAAGIVGALTVYAIFGLLSRGQSQEAYSLSAMIGVTGRVVVGIPKGRYGEVVVSFGGATHKRIATADIDIKSGETVVVTAIAGTALVVAPVGAEPSSASPR